MCIRDRPLIGKIRRSYALPDGLVLEVNHVDEGQPTACLLYTSHTVLDCFTQPGQQLKGVLTEKIHVGQIVAPAFTKARRTVENAMRGRCV